MYGSWLLINDFFFFNSIVIASSLSRYKKQFIDYGGGIQNDALNDGGVGGGDLGGGGDGIAGIGGGGNENFLNGNNNLFDLQSQSNFGEIGTSRDSLSPMQGGQYNTICIGNFPSEQNRQFLFN